MIATVLLWALASLSKTDALRRQRISLSFSRSSSSSSSSSSFEHTGGVCLNGGTSVPSLYRREHMFCVCPDGFGGNNCEIVTGALCYEGVGLYYKGTVSQSESGLTCQEWDLETRERYLASDVNSGRHNYCRNIQYRRRPWCYVWKNQELIWEYCDIPRCGAELIPSLPSLAPTVEEPRLKCGQRTQKKQVKIVGGRVASVDSHPWMAAIFWHSKSKDKVFRCGGSLIAPCWVLTAAHCFPDGTNSKARRFWVVLGKNALNETDHALEQTFKVEDIFIHESFDNSDGNFNNDIALMKLKAKRNGQCAKEQSSVKTVCLPPPQLSLQPGATCEISGYGKERQGLWYKSQYLREAQVSVLADSVCRQKDYYGSLITDNMFCAARPDWSQDACEGDSGGPLVCERDNKFFLFGIISWGDGCAQELRPGVYAKVTNYNRWIEEKTGLSDITAFPSTNISR
ncbi:tissue-type plasminogen activator-like [Thalassophryne amazonica]|uniref:tissue-type plasminogen activator-like n=1 Tax=Thalassophryne amazonica TaxID=390379 RepID=UPI0014722B69|nr:tissue-type plasminogen activator-like [Thalassophryne amazonica]